ncbi:hypothetical protein NMY22_g19861 [Coprinellus aureogranulatus]|nr:hypothetical protein NMY22_g19861 [Coprinellus aureogranulatus]
MAMIDHCHRKGELKPIQVVTKIRQGRKASTMITGFEPFQVIDGEEMAEDLRKACAGATSGEILVLITLEEGLLTLRLVAPAVGKAPGSSLEVLVQGKQGKAVVDYLTGKGIPKRWIEVSDLSGKK